MQELIVDPKCLEILNNFKLPHDIGFGKVMSPIMLTCEYKNEKWGSLELTPYQKLSLAPTSKVLHYSQEIFEGMKAYRTEKNKVYLFRPEQNAERFKLSGDRMAMPELPAGTFLKACEMMASYSASLIPNGKGESLYIRPFMIATEESLGIKPSNQFMFIVVASPSGPYFSSEGLNVLIERNFVRACQGGTGTAKTGGNYAGSLLSSIAASKKGYNQILWLDALNKKNIEELSGMNFFAVINNTLVTPALTDTILNGITRKSLIEMAITLGYQVIEEQMDIDELINNIKSGACTEAFSCGTAAVITPIKSIGEIDGTRYDLPNALGPWGLRLKNELVSLQEGRTGDKFGWRKEVLPQLLKETYRRQIVQE